MTPFASVALFRRAGDTVFRPARKEASPLKTQARKSASRFWQGAIVAPDKINRIVVVQVERGAVLVSERQPGHRWIEFRLQHAQAMSQPHLAACLAELGVDADAAPPTLPDVLEINGVIYRREI